MQSAWRMASDGFQDELDSGALTKRELEHVASLFWPQAETCLLANFIVSEAARALRDPVAARRATHLWAKSFARCRNRAAELRGAGRWDLSLALMEDARQLLPADHGFTPYLLQSLAIDSKVLQDWAGSLELVDEALRFMERAGAEVSPLVADLLVLKAGTYISMGLPDLAAGSVEAALSLSEPRRSPGDAWWSAWLAGRRVQVELWNATDRLDHLIFEVTPLLEELEELGSLMPREQRDRVRVELLLAVAERELGAQRSNSSEGGEDRFKRILESPYVDDIGRFTCQSQLAAIALAAGRATEASGWVAAARETQRGASLGPDRRCFLAALEARLELERGSGADTLAKQREALGAAVDDMVSAWSAEEPRPGGLSFLRYSERRYGVGTLIELALAMDPEGGAVRALEVLHSVRKKGSLVRRLSQPDTDLALAIEAACGPQGGALVYLSGLERSHLFTVDRSGIEHEFLPGEWQLRLDSQALDKMLAYDPRSMTPANRALRTKRIDELSESLAGGILPESTRARIEGWASITVVGSDLLGEPRFECLPWGSSRLGLVKPIGYVASLALAGALGARSSELSEPRRALARVVVPGAGERRGYPELPFDRADMERMRGKLVDGAGIEFLVGPDGSHPNIAERLSAIEVLVFLSHGLRDPLAERPSQILISPSQDDDALSCLDVEALPSPPLVFLGVCGSGRGPAREGAGPVGHLGGAFLLAGARAVVLSDADLSYAPTLLMAEEFLGQTGSGVDPAMGMLEARKRLVNVGWSDPRDWARVRVIGLAHTAR